MSLRRLCSAFLIVSSIAFASGCGNNSTSLPSGQSGGPGTITAPSSAPTNAAPSGGATTSPSPSPTGTGGTVTTADAVIPGFTMPLSHHGRWLTDASGRVVIFHGINAAMKLTPYTMQAQGFTQADAAMLAREGFSSVRVWVFWKAIEPSPGVWDDSSLAQLAQFIGWLNGYGITVHINFAQVIWSEMFGGLGFPDWAADDDGIPPMNFGSDVYSATASASIHATFDNLWSNTAYPDAMGLQDHLARAWVHVANYFKNTPGVIAYDIVNEPEGGSQQASCVNPAGCPLFDQNSLTPFYQRVVAAIRTVDTVHMIDYEPEVLAAVGISATYVAAGSDPNLILTWHYYPQTDTGLSTTVPAAFSNFDADQKRNGDGLLLSEFGATDDLTQIQAILDEADTDLEGWLYWAWYSTEPTGNPATPTTETLNPQEGIVMDPTQPPVESNLKTAKLQILDRPYPFLIAGTPTSWNFNTATNVFTLNYSTTGVGATPTAPTVIVVPQRLYPNGFTAAATGATAAITAKNAVTVQNTAGASSVTVTVTPKTASSSATRRR